MTLDAFGSNGSGQLGLGHQNDVLSPYTSQFDDPVAGLPTKVAAGGNMSLVLFDSGAVYRAGISGDRESKASSREAVPNSRFHQVPLTRSLKATLCSATWEASLIVTDVNGVHACGKGIKGELGLGENVTTVQDYVQLRHFPPKGAQVVDIASNVSHTVVVLSNGQVYGWGNGRKGQLGEPCDAIWTPRIIEGLHFPIVRAVCGRDFSMLFGEPSSGQVVALGSDKWSIRSHIPSSIIDWIDVGASWGSVFVLMKTGQLKSWGRNDRGQLAPLNLPPLHRVAVGSEHVIALTACGDVLCWGWGEHGNCGREIDDNGNVASRWNKIPTNSSSDDSPVIGVGAGCATSFFWKPTSSLSFHNHARSAKTRQLEATPE